MLADAYILSEPLNFVLILSGCSAVFLILLNAVLFGVSEGKGGPYVKQMVACLVAITVFVLSWLAKIFRCVV